MKTPFKFLLLLIITGSFIFSCSSNDDVVQMKDDDVSMSDDVDPTDEDADGDDDQASMDGQIIFPTESSVDLNGATITIAGEIIPLNADYTVDFPSIVGSTELAFLSNSNNEILLAGFISEGREQLSIASTATVLFYFASTAYLQNENSKTRILSDIEENEEYLSFVNELEGLFAQDNLVLQNMGFLPILEASIEGIRTINTTNSKVFVESNDIRSKIQLQSTGDGDNTFTVSNRSPRRAQLFAYKTAFTDMDGNRTELGMSQTAEFTEPLFQGRFSAKNFSDFNVNDGNLLYSFNSCGNVFRPTTSEPLALPLEDNEASAEYEIVVVGPGQNNGDRSMTTTEREAFERLSKETFLLDYVLPTLFDIGGRKQAYDNIDGTSKDAALLSVVETFFQNNTEVRQLVFEGEFDEALQTFFSDIRNNGGVFDLLEESYEVVFNNNDISGSFVFTDTLSENLANMTEIITEVSSRLSFFCTDKLLSGISTLESWELIADRGLVTLDPLRAGTQIFNNDLEITANIDGVEENELNDGSITYEWSVSENFDSVLFDDMGNRGTSFTNTINKVGFVSLTSGLNLVDFENIETVTVRAFRDENGGQQLIGTAEMTVNVQDRKFVIRPEDAILRGIEQVNLKVLNLDGSPLVETDEFEFKVVWSTSGAHALFNGNSTLESVFNDNSIVLRNLDDDVENAVQSVRAGIFLKPKDNPDDIPFREVAFEFVDVYISNNNTIEFEVEAEGYVFATSPESGGTRVRFFGGFRVPQEERATRYQIEIMEYSVEGQVREQFSGRTYSWTNSSQADPVFLVEDGPVTPDTNFVVLFDTASINTLNDGFGRVESVIASIAGKAKVTVTLANN